MPEQNDLFLDAKERKRAAQTPLMRQYWKIKDRHPGAILLFRMGDFYETFEADAVVVADVLGITLTKRGNGAAEEIPLAGFPHHALDQHLPKLVQAGHRVAVCEQLEDPKMARQVVKRGVVEVVTPGVAFREGLLAPKRATYLAAVTWGEGRAAGTVGVAFCDASTGEFFATEAPAERLGALLQTIGPAEVVVDKRLAARLGEAVAGAGGASPFAVTKQEDWVFTPDFATETLLRHFQTHSLKGFGLDGLTVGVVAAGAALYYLGETQKGRLPHVRKIRRYRADDHVALDPATQRALELTGTMADGRREGSLVGALDATLTPMGGRLLRTWLVRPLRDVGRVNARLDAVAALASDARLRRGVREALRGVGDLERLVGRICTHRATARDLVALRRTLEQIPRVKEALDPTLGPDADSRGLLARLDARLAPCTETAERIANTLADEPPAQLSAGGTVRDGFSPELDELRRVAGSGKDFLTELQARESKKTGIPSLKVSFNRVFGYYLEVSNAHRDKAPAEWIRKQTLVGAERYVTPELKHYEETILTAQDKILSLETAALDSLREATASEAEAIQENARALAALDVLAGFAETAERHGYTRPTVDDSAVLDIEAGRHPVVERMLPAGEPFIPNSVRLAAPAGGEPEAADALGQIMLITGPNMAGKSVILRQTGLIVLLAQVGSFVPASRARIGAVDALFARVGASDNLAAGESTFLVEMNETANILHNATARSLLLLDEVGRGTSTFDGLSLAWAIVEHLHETPEVAARTLFATHYHELNALADRLPRVRPFRVTVQEHGGRVVFLRTLVPGGADHSYGIEVARMAGLPAPVLARAQEVLAHLEAHDVASEVGVLGDAASDGLPSVRRRRAGAVPEASGLPVALGAPDPTAAHVLDRLHALEPDRLTPLEALMALAELKRLASG